MSEPVPDFERVVAPLSQGELLMPSPFDLGAAAALARNMVAGMNAETLFEIDKRVRLHYRVKVTATVPDRPDLGERDVADATAQGLHPLVCLLETLLDEIYLRQKD